MSDYRPLKDYAFISDCHGSALVSSAGSIDWCCMPRVDSASVFGAILDADKAGTCSIAPACDLDSTARSYIDGTLVLMTTFLARTGEARVFDLFTMRRGGANDPHRQLLRVIEGVRGSVEFDVLVSPRFDFGTLRPWVRRDGMNTFAVIGGSQALVIAADFDLERADRHDLRARITIRPGKRLHLSMRFVPPEDIDERIGDEADPEEFERRFDMTVQWWREWSKRGAIEGPLRDPTQRSAMILKGLSHAPTGALAAAGTTSLPTAPNGPRNWDYRFSWVRDSSFAVRALSELGYSAEADGFRRFVERAAAGCGDEVQTVFGLAGERRLTEIEIEELDGYKGCKPVRVGNEAWRQLQLDVYGYIVDLAWQWHLRGRSPDDDYWEFLRELVDQAIELWREPDSGIWEVRGDRQHFTHSKAMCWTAVDRGIAIARDCMRAAPLDRWEEARAQIRDAVETKGYDAGRGVFVRAFGAGEMDCALLTLPMFGFLDWRDERFVRTVDAIRAELEHDGYLRRYRTDDGLEGDEAAFLPCSFWLAEALARQGKADEARRVFDRASAAANDVGVFGEQFDPERHEMRGNMPQALTHLSHISAAVALQQATEQIA